MKALIITSGLDSYQTQKLRRRLAAMGARTPYGSSSLFFIECQDQEGYERLISKIKKARCIETSCQVFQMTNEQFESSAMIHGIPA